MELKEAMRTNGACRRFREDPIPDEVFVRAMDDARFGPQGGNRQGVRVIVVKDAAKKRRLGELMLGAAERGIDAVKEAMTKNLSADEAAHHRVDVTNVDALFADEIHLCKSFERIPAILVVVVDVTTFHLTDHQLDRISISGGASVYPMVQNLLLSLRAQGVASCLTTLLNEFEPEIRELLGFPSNFAVACFIPVGHPEKGFPNKLTRLPVHELLFDDVFGRELPAAAHV